MLIIFSGLPGVGKTTLSREIAKQIGAIYLRIDSIESGMAASTLKIHPAEDAGYMVGYAVAEDNLRNGQIVIADSVNHIKMTRDAWRLVSEKAGCDAIEVEVICSDRQEHRRRIERRREELPNLRLPRWQAVLQREYHPWPRERLIIDTARNGVTASVSVFMKAHEERRSAGKSTG